MTGESLIGRALAGVGSMRGLKGSPTELRRAYYAGRGMSGIGMTAEKMASVQAGRAAAYRTLRNRGAMRVGVGAGGAVIAMGVVAHKSASGYKQYQGPPSVRGLPTQSMNNYY